MAEVIQELKAVVGADISDLIGGLNKAKGLLGVFAASAAASLGFGAVVGEAAEFDKNLKNIQATAGLTNAQMATLNKELLDIGKNSTAGPQGVVSAFYDIVGGVQDASTWMAILNASIATSEAGQADLKATTQGLIFVMNAYGLSAKEAAMVSDVLTRTVGVGVGTMDQMVAAMSPIAGLAHNLGISFTDLGTAEAYLTTKGNSAGESATELQSIMTALIKPNKEMESAIKALGFSSGSAAIKQLGLVGTIEALKKQAGGSTDALAKMFGRVEALRGVVSLTGGDFAKFGKNFKAGLTGATEAARAIQLQSFSAQFDKLKAELSTLAIQIGQVLLPPLIKIVEAVTGVVDSLMTMNPAIIPIIAGVLALGAAIGPVIGILSGVGAVVGLLLGPIGLVVAGIAALALAFATDFGGIRTTVENVVHGIGEVLSPLIGTVKGIIDQVIAVFTGSDNNSVTGAIAGLAGDQLGFGDKLAAIFTGAIPKLQTAVGDMVGKVGTFISDNFEKAKKGFEDLLGKVGDWLGSDGPTNLAKGLLDLLSGAANWIINTGWPTFKTGIEGLFDQVKSFLESDGVQRFNDGLKTLIDRAADWITNTAIPQVKATFTDMVVQVMTWLQNGGAEQIRLGFDLAIHTVIDWITKTGIPLVKGVFQSLVDAVGTILKDIAQPIIDSINQVIEKIKIIAALAGIKLPGGDSSGGNNSGGAHVGGQAGYATGGYTGNIGTGQVAGVVHGQEYVVPEQGALVVRSGGGGYNGPSTLEVVFRSDEFEQHLSVNIAEMLSLQGA